MLPREVQILNVWGLSAMTWPNVIPFHQRLLSSGKGPPKCSEGLGAHGVGGDSARGKRGGEGEELPEECALGFPERSHPLCSLPTAMLPSLLSQLSRVCRFKVQGLSLQMDTPSYSLLNPAWGSHFFCSHPQLMEPVSSCQQRPPFGLLSLAFHPSSLKRP